MPKKYIIRSPKSKQKSSKEWVEQTMILFGSHQKDVPVARNDDGSLLFDVVNGILGGHRALSNGTTNYKISHHQGQLLLSSNREGPSFYFLVYSEAIEVELNTGSQVA